MSALLEVVSEVRLETHLEVTCKDVGDLWGLGAQNDLVRVVFSHLNFVDLTNLYIGQSRIVEEAGMLSSAKMDQAQIQ